MTRGLMLLILVAALVVVVFAAVGWQTSPDGGSAIPAREEAAAQTREASPEPKAGPSHDGSAASAPEAPAGAMQTKRLAVENMLQVGGFGCVSCTSLAAGTLRKAEGVEGLTYEPESDTYLVTVNDGFRMDEVAEQIRSTSKEYNRRNGLPDSPDWLLKEV